MPTLLQTQFGVDRTAVFHANAAALLVLALACPIWGWIADKVGYGAVLAAGCLLLTFDLTAFFGQIEEVAGHPATLIWWWISFSLAMSSAAVIPALCALSFPTVVRFTGFGFSYNTGSVVAAFAPAIISWIIIYYGKTSVLYYALATCALGVALALASFRMQFFPRHE